MFLDFGLGILSAVLFSRIFSWPLQADFVMAGVVFSVLMDLDFFIYVLKNGSAHKIHRHRDIFHYPLIYIPLGTSFIWLYDFHWAILFATCSLWHFIHDSVGIGWGVRWLYPFGKDYYTFLYRYQPPDRPSFPLKLFHKWKHNEIDELAEQYGDPNWFRNIYLKLHPYAVFEFLVFIAALIVLFL
ncbi:MAG: metal-dependent hydrolase [Parcubacteria group bacterium]|nr:metal-dependent hydrolase [Parcubacteria group bacterium]